MHTLALIALLGCQPDDPVSLTEPTEPLDTGNRVFTDTAPPTEVPDGVSVRDVAPESGYLELWSGGLMRGRAVLPADFDGDGDLDVWTGNPGDSTWLVMNESTPGAFRFVAGQQVQTEKIYWGGVAADFDGDRDPDVFVSGGGNEDEDRNVLYRNVGGDEPLELDIQELNKIDARGHVLINASAGALAFDVELDGDLDVFVSNGIQNPTFVGLLQPAYPLGLNALWANDGDGVFQDVTVQAGMSVQWGSRNSSVLDWDNDGDFDLFELNFHGPNILWENQLVETGMATFVDITEGLAAGEADMAHPLSRRAMCSIVGDLNNDGWEDIVVFLRRSPGADEPEVHPDGHLVWLNLGGTGFAEVSQFTNINERFINRDHVSGPTGAMGCQIEDLDLDGILDVFVGNGSPGAGEVNRLVVSTELRTITHPDAGELVVPWWEDWTPLIDFPSVLPEDYDPHPLLQYPYRTHGTAMADLDGDGVLELLVHNGGPANYGIAEEQQEPDRLFVFDFERPRQWIRVRLEGDGVAVNTDAIGTRVHAVLRHEDGTTYDVWRRRFGGSGFGAQNDPEILVGATYATEVISLEVHWPDGTTTAVDPLPALGDRITVRR